MNFLPSQRVSKAAVPRSVWTKRATLALPLLCLMVFGTIISSRLISGSTGASASSLVPLKGHVPGLVKTSTLVGPTDPNQSISFSIGLQLRNIDSLKSFVDNSTKKNSLTAHQHLTSAQVATAYAPLASSEKSVIDYMKSYGFRVTQTLSQHLMVSFQGTIGDAENAFHLQINNYASPKGQDFYAPATNPAVPANLAGLIQSVIGLDNVAHLARQPISKSRSLTANAVISSSSSNNCGVGQTFYKTYTPSQIATAYNLNGFYHAGFYGEGQTIALVEFDDYKSSDISAYTQCYGGSTVPIQKIQIDGGTGIPPTWDALQVETDIELALSTAPHLAGLKVYEAPNTDQGNFDTWAQIIGKDIVPIISTTWHECEQVTTVANLNNENSLFTLAAAQGQGIFAAAGNFGTNDCEPNVTDGRSKAVDDLASQPYVTGVGGTTLTLNSDNTYNSEQVWNSAYSPGSLNAVGAGGGGISSMWGMPSWQQGPGVNNTYTSATPCAANAPGASACREVPDIALNADPASGYLVYCTVVASCPPSTNFSPSWWNSHGTSAAASMWAAFMALTNEKTLHDGGFNIGFINPYLYQIAQNSTLYANDFHDVTVGDNDGFGYIQRTGVYPATSNYDMASGLGSYNAWNLGQDLEMLANAKTGSRGAPAAKTWYFAEGEVGGSYKEYITILNSTTTDANITVTYFFQGQVSKSVSHVALANLRSTINVNNDLGIQPSAAQVAVAALVTSTNNVPVVVERPMYFNAHNVASGTDVQGATSTGTTFYFAAGDSPSSSQEFLAILNPGGTAANVTVSYASNGQVVETDHLAVAAQQRGTISPKFHGHTTIQVTSDQPIVVERTEYFNGTVPNAGGPTTGASSTMGVTAQGSDWLFAEGYTGNNFQENLVLGNFAAAGTPAVTATINLEYTNGTVQTVTQTVNAQSQVIFDVNNANHNPNCGANGHPACTVSNSVSIEVTSTAAIVAERVQYFHFGLNGHSYPGMDDVVGQPGPASQSIYTFSEGSCGTNFLDWLTLQNPNNTSVVAAITVFTDNTIVQKEITLPAHSRTSVLACDIVNPLVAAYPNSAGYTVSMEVQSFGGPIVAERPLYFSFNGGSGASDIIGYTGN